MTLRPAWLAAVLAISSVSSAEPYSLEDRGGAGVLSGPESLRVEYLGDNDSLGWAIAPNGLSYDRWMSNSTKLLVRKPISAARFGLPSSARLLVSAALGQVMYTPRTALIASVAQLQGDRPYSGWLSGSVAAELVLDGAPLAFTHGGLPYTHLGIEVFGGSSGPWSYAGAIQHIAHFEYLTLEGKPEPRMVGWGVAETRPALSGDVSAFVETTLAALDHEGPQWLSWSGGRPGLYWMGGLRGDAGGMLVAGSVNTTLIAGWKGDPLVRHPASVPTVAYLFARAELRAVGWNASIESPLGDGTVVARQEPLVAELGVGAVARVWIGEFSYAQIFRSNETASLPAPLRTGQLIGQWSYTIVF